MLRIIFFLRGRTFVPFRDALSAAQVAALNDRVSMITNYKGTAVAYFKSHYSISMEELRVRTKTSNIITGNREVLKSGTSKIELRTAQSGNQEM